jgi:hypothetical protein
LNYTSYKPSEIKLGTNIKIEQSARIHMGTKTKTLSPYTLTLKKILKGCQKYTINKIGNSFFNQNFKASLFSMTKYINFKRITETIKKNKKKGKLNI